MRRTLKKDVGGFFSGPRFVRPPSEPTMFTNGDLLFPVRLDSGGWGTEVIHPGEDAYTRYLVLYQQHHRHPGALGAWGWIAAVFFAPVGVLIGVILIAKGKTGGTAILITSVGVWVLAILLLY